MLTGVTVTRQILAVHKTLARNGLRTLALVQERGDRMARSFLAPGGEDATGGERLWEHWSETGQAGRKVFETAVDAYFEMLEGMLLPGDGARSSNHDR
jgi:hypothetical protein